MTNIKAEILKFVSSKDITEDCGHAWPAQPNGGKGRCMSCASIAINNYTAKLEALVLELGEVVEASDKLELSIFNYFTIEQSSWRAGWADVEKAREVYRQAILEARNILTEKV